MMDWDVPEPAGRMRTMRFGFVLVACAMASYCLQRVVHVYGMLTGDVNAATIQQHRLWFWLVESSAPWLYVIGAYMLWASLEEPAWRRVAGLLVVLNVIGVGLWGYHYHEELGIGFGQPWEAWWWLLWLVSAGLAWVKLVLVGTLVASWSTALKRARLPLRSTSGINPVAVAGLIVWAMMAVSHTRWRFWPPRPNLGAGLISLYLLTLILSTVAYFIMCVGCLESARRVRAQASSSRPGVPGEDLLRGPHDDGDDPFAF